MSAKKLASQQKPNIFDHVDHLLFLKSWFEFLKSEERISMRAISEKAQLAIGYLPMCLSGKRSLSSKALSKMAPHLKLSLSEQRFLELLHTVGTSENPEVRLRAVGDMTKLQAFKKTNNKELEVYKYLTNWYYVAIREMVALADFDPNPAWLQARLNGKVSLADCEEAIRFLVASGFVTVSAQGKYTIPKMALDCKEGIYKMSLGEFHREMFRFAAESIENVARANRSIMGHTVAIRTEDLPHVTEILNEAITKLHTLGQKTTNADQVYHIELAAFPLTQKKIEKEKI